ncbi:DUF6457 domain-containing protein [Corynebacterium sp. NML180780]|uniref:DUF6457 domain-containing protein n=1 Tax=Corynebacterium sp. NML180780 TaxID=2598459 RepID=UPI00164699E7|nr:DUF6457 domain-containing protein [Corynebacterium sp. NML180780]
MAKDDALHTTHEWLAAVAKELGVAPEAVRSLVGDVLDLTAAVAHNGPSRPAAPTTAFLVGLAAGQQLGPDATPDATESATRKLIEATTQLLERYGTTDNSDNSDGSHAGDEQD